MTDTKLSSIDSKLGLPHAQAEAQSNSFARSADLSTNGPKEQTAGSSRSRKSRDSTVYVVGTEIFGVVCGIEDYGMFIRLANGESGLVFDNEICWPGENITHRLGERVKVLVLSFKEGRGLALSIRETRVKASFEAFQRNQPVGSSVQGHIKTVLDYGIFVTLAPGVAGLVHLSEIPSMDAYGKSSLGQPIDVRVISIDQTTNRISLSLNQ